MIAPVLKGKKIILKPIQVKQAGRFLEWFGDDEVIRFLLVDGKKLNLKKEIAAIKRLKYSPSHYTWSIYTKNKIHIGSTGLSGVDKNNQRATWGIVIGDKKYWNQGFGTDVLKTVMKFFFTRLKFNRLELKVFPENLAGRKVYKRCGFKKEGLLRQAVYKRGKYYDEIVMSVLKNEYKKFKK